MVNDVNAVGQATVMSISDFSHGLIIVIVAVVGLAAVLGIIILHVPNPVDFKNTDVGSTVTF